MEPAHFLDATLAEEAATPLRLLLMFSFDKPETPHVQGMRTLGNGELSIDQLTELLKVDFSFFHHVFFLSLKVVLY